MIWIRKHWLILTILAVAVLVRVLVGLERDRWPFSQDEYHWERLGMVYATHGILVENPDTYRPPLYPLLLATIYNCFGQVPVIVRMVQAAMAALTCFLVYRAGCRLGNATHSYIAAACAALYPLWVFVSGMLLAETLLVMLVAGACLATLKLLERVNLTNAAVLGLVLGLGILCKPVGLPWALVVAIGVWIRLKGTPVANRLNVLGAVLCGGLVVITPWIIRNEALTGHRMLMSTNLGMNLLIGHEPRANGTYVDGRDYWSIYNRIGGEYPDAISKDAAVAREVGKIIVENPLRSVRLALRKVFLFWSSFLHDGPRWARNLHFMVGSCLVLASGFGLYRNRGNDLAWIAISCVVVWTLLHALFFTHPRFRLPVDLALMPFAGAGLHGVFLSIKSAVGRRVAELDRGAA
ncbi:TPA: hypothetical protein DCE37_03725 [Candidatus Latescibacteria bacterium]|nr:hypothetical protein [Candidatus Latescibacterota bacterium]